MQETRRCFLKQLGTMTGLAVCASQSRAGDEKCRPDSNPYGVLVDTTRCVGCRRCEKACNGINTDLPRRNAAYYEDKAVFEKRRRMDDTTYTVVNRYRDAMNPAGQVYAKFQCMHCRQPACVSACIVGALTKDKATGAIVYDASKCIGCRYCIVACPFQVAAYEYGNALTPQVRKCHWCHETRLSKGLVPACVEACPMEAMTFGKRTDLLTIARERMSRHQDRYVPGVYGEHEVGGTAWLYISGVPFENIDLPRLGDTPIPDYTEPVQKAIFKWFLPPLGLYALLGLIWHCLAAGRKTREDEAAQ